MAPLRDAVGLVDGVERHGHGAQELDVLFLGERLGGHVQHLGLAADDVGADLIGGRARQGGVEEMGYGVVAGILAHGVDLVFHQGDEGGDDDGHALAHERRELVAERLAAAGGHEHEHVAPPEQGADDGLLVSLEGLEAEVALQGRMHVATEWLHSFLLLLLTQCFFLHKPIIRGESQAAFRVWAHGASRGFNTKLSKKIRTRKSGTLEFFRHVPKGTIQGGMGQLDFFAIYKMPEAQSRRHRASGPGSTKLFGSYYGKSMFLIPGCRQIPQHA